MKKHQEADPTRVAVNILVGFFVLMSPLVIWEMSKAPSPSQVILNEALKMSFHGKVDSIYFDKHDHNAEYLLLTDGFKYPLYDYWQFRAQKGDSLAKKKGDLLVYVFKRNGTKDIFDYKELVKIYNRGSTY